MGKRKEREGIVFLNEHLKVLSRVFKESERGRMIEYLRAYSMEGEIPDLSMESELFRTIYDLMRAAQDSMIDRYKETCERNRRAALVRTARTVRMEEDDMQQLAAHAATCSWMQQDAASAAKQNKTNQNKTKLNMMDLPMAEETGVPGIGWL